MTTCKHCDRPGGNLRRLVNRFDLETPRTLTLCDPCYAKEASLIARRRNTRDERRAALEAHPVNYDATVPIGGRLSQLISDSHLVECLCLHCQYAMAHSDDGVDA